MSSILLTLSWQKSYKSNVFLCGEHDDSNSIFVVCLNKELDQSYRNKMTKIKERVLLMQLSWVLFMNFRVSLS